MYGMPVPRVDDRGDREAQAQPVVRVRAGVELDLHGIRWTTFTQLPVAFSAGSRPKTLPVPADRLSTVPVKERNRPGPCGG